MTALLHQLSVMPARMRASAPLPSGDPREILRAGLTSALALALGTAGVAFLESPAVGIADASPLYLVAVVAVGVLHGTRAAVVTALAAFAAYDVLFTEPRLTFTVADPREWLDLLLLLFVALVIGQLAARETERAREATGRARESEALFAISRTLATTARIADAAPAIVERLATETRMSRVWISLAAGTGESIIADTLPGVPVPVAASVWSLMRAPGDRPARWVAVHAARPGLRPAIGADLAVWGAPMTAEAVSLGTVWSLRPRSVGDPSREETRLLSLAADQLALALRREQLSTEATKAEIARQSDALKSALLDSVSHDLRTPLSSIRATAGSLMDPAVAWSTPERLAAGRGIDAEAERLSALVENVLDLSRIEGGALHPDLEALDPRELVELVVARVGAADDGPRIALELADLPPIRADAVLFDTVVANLLENAVRHAGPDAPIRVAGVARDGWVELSVEDGGVGVPDETLPRLFGKFYRVPGRPPGSRSGLGIGLSIVQGFVEAMGGRVWAERSSLGGLAVRLRLPVVPEPPER
jgi:two-component system, OmpR family, sensor histidine kinase KdpD